MTEKYIRNNFNNISDYADIIEQRIDDSYLNMERIVSATIVTGAEAIHPGFGFLSENSRFVDMCKKCPTTLSEMLEVSGVGSVKLNMYGDRFLQVLRSYNNFNNKEF